MTRMLSIVLCALALVAFVGCNKSDSTTPPKADDHGHSHDDGHDHAADEHDHADDKPAQPAPAAPVAPAPGAADVHSHDAGSHGPAIALGEGKIADWTVRASRDQGELKPGGEAAIDVWLTGGASIVVAVRFWVGTEDAAGSVKAKADIEDLAEPNHWHSHAELPSPMPADAKLWVEIETEGGKKTAGSFELKM